MQEYRLINNDFLLDNILESNSIDLIVTSPPYNLNIEYNSINDNLSYNDYYKFSSEWLSKCYNLLKPDGRICINIPVSQNINGKTNIIADIHNKLIESNFSYYNTIIWNKNTILNRCAWGSWMSASCPYISTPVEFIIVYNKGNKKKTSGSKKSDITKDEFIKWTNGLWTIAPASAKKIGHPAPFPVELPTRLIKLFSYVNDTILDPFTGSGSTIIAALQNNRKAIGFEIDEMYCNVAKERIRKETEQCKLFY